MYEYRFEYETPILYASKLKTKFPKLFGPKKINFATTIKIFSLKMNLKFEIFSLL